MDVRTEMVELLKGVDGFQVGITVLKGGMLTNHLFTDNFPLGDMLVSNKEIRDLIIKELEKPNKEAL